MSGERYALRPTAARRYREISRAIGDEVGMWAKTRLALLRDDAPPDTEQLPRTRGKRRLLEENRASSCGLHGLPRELLVDIVARMVEEVPFYRGPDVFCGRRLTKVHMERTRLVGRLALVGKLFEARGLQGTESVVEEVLRRRVQYLRSIASRAVVFGVPPWSGRPVGSGVYGQQICKVLPQIEHGLVMINVKVVASDGSELYFKISLLVPLEKVISTFCDRHAHIDRASAKFMFDRKVIRGESTPAMLEMEDRDIIDCWIGDWMPGGLAEAGWDPALGEEGDEEESSEDDQHYEDEDA